MKQLSKHAHIEHGFTLVELMVAVFLSGFVVMAAFHVHTTYQAALNRQEEIARMQQTMKVTRELLVNRIRGAGGGVSSDLWTDCGGFRNIGPFVFHNSNTFGVSDTSEGGTDNDPDWFEVLAADYNSSGVVSQQSTISQRNKLTDDAANFQVGDLLLIQNEHGSCLLIVSAVLNNQIHHQTHGEGGNPFYQCYGANLKNCRDVMQTNHLEAGSPLINMGRRSAAFRVDDSDPKRPMLMMAAGQAGGDPNLYDWQPIAEGVEDMQIAVHIDTDNPPNDTGNIWVNSRDLVGDETSRVRAVRLSMVFRSTREIPGWNRGRRPALEDRPASTQFDGYVRRTFTTIIKLRNMPREVVP